MFNPHPIQGSYREEAAKEAHDSLSLGQLQAPTSRDPLYSTEDCAQQFHNNLKGKRI